MKSKRDSKKRSRPVQIASQAQIVADEREDLTPIVEFLEQFRILTDPRAQHKSKLISIKMPEPLLAAFRYKAEIDGVPYQSMIKRLMP